MSLWDALRTQVLCLKFLIYLISSKILDLIQLLWAPEIEALHIAEIDEFLIFLLPPLHSHPPMIK